jgi:hypothetical protein
MSLELLNWVAVAWVGLGVAELALIVIYPMVTGASPDFDFSDPFEAILVPILLLLTAPFWVGLAMWFAGVKLWQGEIPFTEKRLMWWSNHQPEEHPKVFDRGSALASLVAIRVPESQSEWPMFRHWDSPESVVLEISESFWNLKEEGLEDEVVLARIEIERSEFGSLVELSGLNLAQFTRLRLRLERDDHSLINEAHLAKQLVAAKEAFPIYKGRKMDDHFLCAVPLSHEGMDLLVWRRGRT